MKKLAHEFILDRIKQQISDNDWKPGQRLPTMQQIAAQFGLSITSVREALRILESQQVISIEHGRGMFLQSLTALNDSPAEQLQRMENHTLLELLEARLVLEPELAALCTARANANQRKQLKELSDLMTQQMTTGGDFFATDLQFHHLIAECAGNNLLSQMLSAISDLSAAGRRETNELPYMREKAANYHQLIAIAVQEQLPNQARDLMKAHILDMINALQGIENHSVKMF